jgi:hypothetical protein
MSVFKRRRFRPRSFCSASAGIASMDRMADFPTIAEAAPVGREGFRRPPAQRRVHRRHYGKPDCRGRR